MSDRPSTRIARAVALSTVIVGLVAACATGGQPGVTFPAGSIGPNATVSPAIAQVKAALASALAVQSLTLVDGTVAYRPVEAAELIGAPRIVLQVQLPADPGGGYVSVYEFRDAQAAAAAAQGQADYLATGPGRVQSPRGTIHVIRQYGAAVLYFHRMPDADPDPATPRIQAALETIGTGFPVPG